MPENQNIEWKETWHDDYLKWACGFANADGGTIFIGKADDGSTVGIEKVRTSCEAAGISMVSFDLDSSGVMASLRAAGVTDPVTGQVESLLEVFGSRELNTHEIMGKLGLSHRQTFRDNYLRPALNVGLVERTIPDKPGSRLQKYRRARTAKG